ncbi:DUF72 domain-containing protein [Candidatus Shapirobacteria bacterium CG10_big_fil_rev_8_21_14_0_10_38_14]|uniref:DUF72 domain-containing protein n=1 Tax=Candidatus Shapirobacteria bacterium CG10_big_fil_rev_8_21_14_0_10_38_14 TaxID=1974483 RepID=A0A2M8L5V7_9BACT|nr:MAG: DUF72 domain-containing protein [Candidatus Shapirobacteria bacterium CG10_big_fil_rev_8_21_14_0_10_38_14]
MPKASAFIGTSGFFYKHWQGVFYPETLPQKDWFGYYVRHFDTVELNVSFYRLPKKTTFENWRAKAGKKFVFAVKGSHYITHIKRLKDCQEPLARFFEAASGLHSRSGPRGLSGSEVVLWQLPPRFKANISRLGEFLRLLVTVPTSLKLRGARWRHAVEFRNKSWLSTEIYNLLRQYNAAIVFQDFADWPITEEATADFVYLRFHGRTRLYSSCYTERELGTWAEKIKSWQKQGLDVYVYFNNDALGYAVENAKTLKKLCLEKS